MSRIRRSVSRRPRLTRIWRSWVTICGLLEEIIECWRMIFTTWRKLGALLSFCHFFVNFRFFFHSKSFKKLFVPYFSFYFVIFLYFRVFFSFAFSPFSRRLFLFFLSLAGRPVFCRFLGLFSASENKGISLYRRFNFGDGLGGLSFVFQKKKKLASARNSVAGRSRVRRSGPPIAPKRGGCAPL